MGNPHRTDTAEFKVRVVMELITGKKSLGEAGREYGIKDSVISRWRQEFMERAPQIFEPPAAKMPRVTAFTANRPNKTVSVHKPECNRVPWDNLDPCGCGDTGEGGNQRWFCERHITIDKLHEFMGGKMWAVLLCEVCFRER